MATTLADKIRAHLAAADTSRAHTNVLLTHQELQELSTALWLSGNIGEGAPRIAAERARQRDTLGWSKEHDDEHVDGSLSMAAACYAAPFPVANVESHANGINIADPWPWDPAYDKRPRDQATDKPLPHNQMPITGRIRCLEKAGALCAAEIDRLLRLKAKGGV